MGKKQTKSCIRVIIGWVFVLTGVICNRWLLVRFLSDDGNIELSSEIGIWAFDIVMIVAGLLLVLAGRRTIINLCLAVTVTLITLIVVDLASRPILRDSLYYRPGDMFKNRLPSMPSQSRFDKNVTEVISTYGDMAAMSGCDDCREMRMVRFQTDDFGFRNSDYDPDKPVDIIVLGDSFGAGEGTTQPKIVASLLQSEYGFHTYNLSMSGYNLWQELIDLQAELPRLKTHENTVVLWTVFAGNDFETPYGNNLEPPPSKGWIDRMKVSFDIFRRRSPIFQYAQRIYYSTEGHRPKDSAIAKEFINGEKMYFYSGDVEVRDRTYEEFLKHRNHDKARVVLEQMKTIADKKGFEVAVVLIPSKPEVYSWVFDENELWTSDTAASGISIAIEAMCDENGFEFLDLKPTLIAESQRLWEKSEKLLYWYDDTHWNNNGNEFVASVVNEVLSNRTEHDQ